MNNTCPHFSLCSGCELGANLFHPPIWQEALAYFKTAAPHLSPQLHHEGFQHTRLKAKLAVRHPSQIGLFKKGTHDVLPIPHCHTHHPSINRAVALLNDQLLHTPIPLYREQPPSGLLRYVQLAADRHTDKVQLTLVLNATHSTPQIAALAASLQPHLHSLWLNFQPAPTNQILGPTWQHLYGEPFLWHTLNDTPVAFHPGAFSQSHLSLFEKMLLQISSYIHPHQNILELYAGAGAIGLSLRHHNRPIQLVENNPFAHLSFLQSLSRLPPHQQSLFSYHPIDAKHTPLSSDLIIVDPPRKGIDPALLPKLTHASTLIYISCNFPTFQRDAAHLISSHFHLHHASGYLLFPGTNHVELFALFSKSS